MSSGVSSRFALYSEYVSLRNDPGGIEYNGQCEGFVANDVEQRIGKAKNGACVQALELIRGFLMKA